MAGRQGGCVLDHALVRRRGLALDRARRRGVVLAGSGDPALRDGDGIGSGGDYLGAAGAKTGCDDDNSSKLGRRGEAHLVSEHARVALELALLNPVSDQGTVQLALVEAGEGLLVLRHRGRECDWKWNKP